jgi:hypothetical protein
MKRTCLLEARTSMKMLLCEFRTGIKNKYFPYEIYKNW